MAWYDQYLGGTTVPTTGGTTTNLSGPPGQMGQGVWEEDKKDDPLVSVDYTTPVDTSQFADTGSNISTANDITEEPIDGRSAAIQASQEERRLRNIQQLKSLYASTMSSPAALGGALYEGLDLATIFESFGADPTIKPDNASYNYADMPSQGQIPITDWDKLNFLHHLGLGTNVTGKEGLGAFFAVDDWGNAILDSSGNLIKTGLGNTMSDNFNEIVYGTPSTFNPEEQLSMEEQFGKVAENYWTGRREENREGNTWDNWWGQPQEYGMFDSLADLAKHTWFSESLSDVEAREQQRLDEGLGVATMADMEQ